MKRILAIMLVFILVFTGCNSGDKGKSIIEERNKSVNLEESPSETLKKSQPITEKERANVENSEEDQTTKKESEIVLELTEDEKLEYIEKYLSLEPDACLLFDDLELQSLRFGRFYANNSDLDPKYDAKQFEIEGYPNYEIPQNIYEEFIQKYFDVTTDVLRLTSFYDKDRQIYTGFLCGGGIPYETRIISVKKNGEIIEIEYVDTSLDKAEPFEYKSVVGIKLKDDGSFKYKYVKGLN